MADIEVKSGPDKGGKPRSKKLSTRIDLTPMVDLGFLLITFFIFTTTMTNPSTMNLVMPDDTATDEQKQKAAEEGAVTIIVDDKKSPQGTYFFYYGNIDYEGTKLKQLSAVDVQTEYKTKLKLDRAVTIRDIILDVKQEAKRNDVEMVCVIKPTADATYANVIDILDEMTINQVKLYTLSKMNLVEKKHVAARKQL